AGERPWGRRWVAVEKTIALARERASLLTDKHKIEVSIEGELPSVRVDENLLAEVLYSLIDNAAKYSPTGSRIRIAARRPDENDEDEMIQMSVEDEGYGIPPELRERVFDKFFRATDKGAPSLGRPKGLGMGLSIARGIIAAHGGRIWVESGAAERGTRVVLTIPIGDEENAEPMNNHE